VAFIPKTNYYTTPTYTLTSTTGWTGGTGAYITLKSGTGGTGGSVTFGSGSGGWGYVSYGTASLGSICEPKPGRKPREIQEYKGQK